MRVMNQALHPLIGTCVIVYFDNIFIYSKFESNHLQHLLSVLKILRAEGFFCGHIQVHILYGLYSISRIPHLWVRN